MKVITGDRQSGKTTEAIKLANEEDAYLAVHTRARARQVYHSDQYPDLDRFPITYSEIRSLRKAGYHTEIVIDDLDLYLKSEVEHPVVGVSMTASETIQLEEQ